MATSGRYFRSVLAGNRYCLQFFFVGNLAFQGSFAYVSGHVKGNSQRGPVGPSGRGPREGRRGPGPSYVWLIAGDGAEPGVKSRLWSAVHATACSMSDRYRCCRLLCMLATLPTGTQLPATREFAPARQSAPDPTRQLADALTGVRCPTRAPNNGGRTAASWGRSQPAPLASSSSRGRPDSTNSTNDSSSHSSSSSSRSEAAPGDNVASITGVTAARWPETATQLADGSGSPAVPGGDAARWQPGSTKRRRRSLAARQLGSTRRRRSSHDNSSSNSAAPGGSSPDSVAARRTTSQLAGRQSRSSSGSSSSDDAARTAAAAWQQAAPAQQLA